MTKIIPASPAQLVISH